MKLTASNSTVQSCHFVDNTWAGVNSYGRDNPIQNNFFKGNFLAIYLQWAGHSEVFGNSIGPHPISGAVFENRKGIFIASDNNKIGGTGASDGNVISTCDLQGIDISWTAASNSIRGNLIGTDGDGLTAYPNLTGIDISGSFNTIGGIKPGARNIISGNSHSGIKMQGSPGGYCEPSGQSHKIMFFRFSLSACPMQNPFSRLLSNHNPSKLQRKIILVRCDTLAAVIPPLRRDGGYRASHLQQTWRVNNPGYDIFS